VLSPEGLLADRARQLLRSSECLRPVRLLLVGTEAVYSIDDQKFLRHARDFDIPISYVPNSKRKASVAARRVIFIQPFKLQLTMAIRVFFKDVGKFVSQTAYADFTLAKAFTSSGASQSDLLWDYRLRFPKHESDERAHLFGHSICN
jgi:hypothetical protein